MPEFNAPPAIPIVRDDAPDDAVLSALKPKPTMEITWEHIGLVAISLVFWWLMFRWLLLPFYHWLCR